MDGTIHLRVLTPEGVALEDDAVSVIAPGELGYLGILRQHAPLVTTLVKGRLTWKQPSGSARSALLGPGLLEVSRNRLTILTHTFSETPSPA